MFSAKKVEGKVWSKNGDVSAIHVLNITQKKAAITNVSGYFSIVASLNDTLVFSAVQYKRKELVMTNTILKSNFIQVPLEEALNELEGVIVTPYSLTGNLYTDMGSLEIKPITTSATLGLPNAYVKPPTQSQRKLYEATSGGGLIPVNLIINAITGRTKMLKQRVAREEKYARTGRVQAFYVDSIYTKELKIPKDRVADFMYFCEVDPVFTTTVDSHDRLQIWEYLKKKSLVYRTNNTLD
ncbi:MAG: hypothetical protein V3U92_09775 [Cellulophaga sp.]